MFFDTIERCLLGVRSLPGIFQGFGFSLFPAVLEARWAVSWWGKSLFPSLGIWRCKPSPKGVEKKSQPLPPHPTPFFPFILKQGAPAWLPLHLVEHLLECSFKANRERMMASGIWFTEKPVLGNKGHLSIPGTHSCLLSEPSGGQNLPGVRDFTRL